MRHLLLMSVLLASFVAFAATNTLAQAPQITTICAGSQVPAGWVHVNDYWDPTTCGRPFQIVYNVWVIQNLQGMPRGSRVVACYTQPPPTGWGIQDHYWNPLTCGHPVAIVDNEMIIQCDSCPQPTPTPTPTPGPQFQGSFDEASCNAIAGWVWNSLTPTTPLRVDILVNNTVFAQVSADQFRQDLLGAGKGDGRHGFRLDLPARLKNNRNNAVSIRVTGTNFFLSPNRNFTCPNPIDDTAFFVRQHYLDFLSREPDSGGLAFWINEITQCGTDAACIDYRRVQVSKAFFLSIEFQETGFFLTRFYKAAFARMPTIAEFSADKNILSDGLVVGSPGWENVINGNKSIYTSTFVTRSNFLNAYSPLLNSEFVNQLCNNAQISDQGFRDTLINQLNNGQISRATAMRQIIDDQGFFQREFNPAFVMMQYIGYLRRHPSDPPDGPSMPGFFFWLNSLNSHGDQNEMVHAFLLSAEYRNRFGIDLPYPSPPGSSMMWYDSDSFELWTPAPPCADSDGDGFCDEEDCNPYDASVYPGAPIYCEEGQDRNCNGLDDYWECYYWW